MSKIIYTVIATIDDEVVYKRETGDVDIASMSVRDAEHAVREVEKEYYILEEEPDEDDLNLDHLRYEEIK